ncbi:MAG: DNA-binding response regulator [Ferruginibacter sp.]|nr:DNA-binding response regulator [Chitinophagaceae bacterium]
MNTNILIVEDELITAETIAELLQEEEHNVMGIAKSAAEAIAICEKGEVWPAIVICDINIKGAIKGTELSITLKNRFGCEIIFLTAYSDAKTVASAFESEPVMYVVKPFQDSQLLVAVQLAFHKILKKQQHISTSKLELTSREKEIAHLIAEGMSSKQIARKLMISIETVKTHRRRMLQKNNISNFPHLVYLLNKEN